MTLNRPAMPPFPPLGPDRRLNHRQRTVETVARMYLENPTMRQVDIGRAAGLTGKDSGVNSRVSKMLAIPEVKGWLAECVQRMDSRRVAKLEDVMAETTTLALYDPGAIAKHAINKPEDIAELPEDLRRCITGWKWDKAGNFVIDLADKNPHLERLARYLGAFVDRKQVDVNIEITQKSDAELEAEIKELAGNLGIDLSKVANAA